VVAAPKRKSSPLFYNVISYAGTWLAFFIFLAEGFLFIIDFYSKNQNLYIGLLTYIILPPFLFLGLALIPLGALWKQRRVRKGLTELAPKPIHIDPSIPSHRNAIFVFMTGTFLVIVMSLIGSYKAFHYTESVQFCGVLCHEIMDPEYTAYTHSPHGRVKCVDCHIGAGADWYVRSKLSGARQVYKAITRSFERPIKTPVENLRPAEETCKQCHWPGKYFSTMDLRRTYFLSEGDKNPEWHLRMLLNVGGGKNQSSGVHAHMNLDRDIYYAAEDRKRQKISWIKAVDKDGKEEIFISPNSKWKTSTPPAGVIRKMDCIDCHNRPTHLFVPPYRLVDQAMRDGAISADIPKIKEKSTEVLSKTYLTGPEAVRSIREELQNFYETKYADYDASHPRVIDQAIQEITTLYQQNMFPEMKARWDTHPDNIGHLIVPGCFRCHDGEHKSQGNKLISRDCKTCHLIIEQGPAGKIEKNIEGLDFIHPAGGEEWKEMNCADCHTGGA